MSDLVGTQIVGFLTHRLKYTSNQAFVPGPYFHLQQKVVYFVLIEILTREILTPTKEMLNY